MQETLRPELIAVLREHLPPLNSRLFEQYQQRTTGDHLDMGSKLSEYYKCISSDIHAIKVQLQRPTLIQQRLECCFRGGNGNAAYNGTHSLQIDQSLDSCAHHTAQLHPAKDIVDSSVPLKEM